MIVYLGMLAMDLCLSMAFSRLMLSIMLHPVHSETLSPKHRRTNPTTLLIGEAVHNVNNGPCIACTLTSLDPHAVQTCRLVKLGC